MQRGGKVQEVDDYIYDALVATEDDRAALYEEYQAEMARLETEIAGLRNDIRDLNAERDATVIKITQLRSDIQSLSVKIDALVEAIEALA